MCQECLGLGKVLKGDEFAPLCQSCARWVMSWLEARGKAHAEKFLTAGGRLTIATPGDLAVMLSQGRQAAPRAPGTARISLPGIGR